MIIKQLPGAAGEGWCEKYQEGWMSARQWASRKPTVGWILPIEKRLKEIINSEVVLEHALPEEKKIMGTDMYSKG